MRKILIIISLFLVFCKYALTKEENGRWIWYWETTDKDEYYYDMESINWTSDDIVEVWTKTIYSENSELKKKWISILIKLGVEPEKATGLSGNITLRKIDIKNRKIAMLSSVDYDKNGNVLDSSDYHNVPTWTSIVPDSINEVLWKIMCELKEVGILKELIEKDPKNPIYYYLLGKEWEGFVKRHGLEFAFVTNFVRNRTMDTFFNLQKQNFEKAVENSISIDTFPFEMVFVKNAVVEKEDLFKILKGIFFCDLLSSSVEARSDVKTLGEITEWWISKQNEIRPDLEIIFIVDQFPGGKKEVRIDENFPEKLCEGYSTIGSSIIDLFLLDLKNPDKVKTEINSIIDIMKEINPSSPEIEALEKELKEALKEKIPLGDKIKALEKEIKEKYLKSEKEKEEK